MSKLCSSPLLGMGLGLSWNSDRHGRVISRKTAILKQLRFVLSVEMTQRLLPAGNGGALALAPVSPADQKAQVQENAQSFLSSHDHRLVDYIRCHNLFGLYSAAYKIHRYTWPLLSVVGLVGAWYFEEHRNLVWVIISACAVGILVPWLAIIYWSDQLHDLGAEYEVSE